MYALRSYVSKILKKITQKSTNACGTKSKIPYQRWDPFTCEGSDRHIYIYIYIKS